ncbi:MAG: K(+)-transporting ATPase subunit C [Acidobacteria bacterium]|nr:K(+)-transporting ATPase subunit C [Acidobacteriota bacterium]
MWKQMMPALRMTVLLTVLTGLIYPAVVTGLCQTLFPSQANGSLLTRDGKVVGSSLIGQGFGRPEYFPSRPPAAGNDGYDASASGGSNLGPLSKKLAERVDASAKQIRADTHEGEIPADALTASASGLDPHISPEFAKIYTERVAAARGVSAAEMEKLVAQFTEGRDLGYLGEPRVNVLLLNLALDERLPVRR